MKDSVLITVRARVAARQARSMICSVHGHKWAGSEMAVREGILSCERCNYVRLPAIADTHPKDELRWQQNA